MKTLTELQTDHSTFSIGEAMSDGWKLVSKNLGYYILGGIIAVAISAGVGIIPIVGGVANNLILSPCLMAGAIYVTWRISKGIAWTDFGEMFKGFNFLSPIMISSIIQFAATFILGILFLLNYLDEMKEIFQLAQGADAFNNQEELKSLVLKLFTGEFVVLFLLLMLAILLISVIWVFKIHFIVIYNMQAWPAMDMSRKLASRNFLSLIALFIVLGVLILISAIPCGIGLLFSLPLSIGAVYSAFAQITHSDSDYEGDEKMFDFEENQNQA
ncbi:MAG: hypothetical protein IPL84_10190 [Chitinophagaceae bacterium]|nr:hypothetical protein [Chitinophagaceae bacterium]